ncbi:MAG: acyl-ACP thioesterase domain-containing protein [Christensenellales bacterium]
MKVDCEQKIKVLASQTDMKVEMGLIQSIAVVQDNMCEYFKHINCDGLTLLPKCDCFFVLTKTKIHFDKFAKWLDEFNLTTELSDLSRVAVTLKTDFKDLETNESFVTCFQELCAMDNTSRKLRMINTTPFPSDIEINGEREKVFNKFNIEFDDKDLVKEEIVSSVNIDLYQHTNNVEYVRLMMSTLDKEFILNNTITDFEIHYISESKYGSLLRIYRKEIDGVIYFEIKHDDKIITKAMLNYKKS